MSLVNYSSSDEDDDTQRPAIMPIGSKRKQDQSTSDPPPLPPKFYDLYASTSRISTRDDASLHGGRKRTTPHIEGNWPTHIYIEWVPTTTEYGLLGSLITSIQGQASLNDRIGMNVTSSVVSELGAPLPLHVSLSRPISLATEQKDPFVASLRREVSHCNVRPFMTTFSNLEWVSNYENTRWFLVLRLRKPSGDNLNRLLGVCNRTVKEYGQPPLYAPQDITGSHLQDSEKHAKKICRERGSEITSGDQAAIQDVSDTFHISIGWALEHPTPQAAAAVRAAGEEDIFRNVQKISVNVEEIKVKVGNIVTNILLPLKTTEVEGLFGF